MLRPAAAIPLIITFWAVGMYIAYTKSISITVGSLSGWGAIIVTILWPRDWILGE